jgi:hypothetical protein
MGAAGGGPGRYWLTFYRDGTHGSMLEDPVIGDIAAAHGKTPASSCPARRRPRSTTWTPAGAGARAGRDLPGGLWPRDPRGLRGRPLLHCRLALDGVGLGRSTFLGQTDNASRNKRFESCPANSIGGRPDGRAGSDLD